MTGVAELLATAGASAPVQRVRNYHLADREASPRPRDFLTAMKRSDGAVCLRWPGPPGDCLVRYVGGGIDSKDRIDAETDWQCAKHNRFRGRTNIETFDAERVRGWIRRSRPELVAHAEVRATFEEPSVEAAAEAGTQFAADGGSVAGERVRVHRYADLLAPGLSRRDADALAVALPTPAGELVFRLPPVLAAESVLDPVAESDCVFVAEAVPDRETDRAYYVRQGRRGCWVPKAEATVYELADSAMVEPESNERPGSA